MIVDKKSVDELELTEDCLGASIIFRYQKTGGVYMCPNCKITLGTPKQNHGTVIGTNERPKCPNCGNKSPVLKFAQLVTRPGAITRVIMRKTNGDSVVAKVKLNKEDKFDKGMARFYALDRLYSKCAVRATR